MITSAVVADPFYYQLSDNLELSRTYDLNIDAITYDDTTMYVIRAKKNLIGGFPLRISSNGKIVEYLAMMGFYDYPLDWLDTITGKLAAVDVEQVRDAFSRRISAPAGIAVIVGGNNG